MGNQLSIMVPCTIMIAYEGINPLEQQCWIMDQNDHAICCMLIIQKFLIISGLSCLCDSMHCLSS